MVERGVLFELERLGDLLNRVAFARIERKEQAEQAIIFQRQAMRFFRWCVENDPEFKAGGLASFRWLLGGYNKLHGKLKKLEDSGEVEF